MSPQVFIRSAPENYTQELALHCHALLPPHRDGTARPLATADAFGRFLDAWRHNDPNGIWGWVTEVGDKLICTYPDSDESETFPLAARNEEGQAVYDLTGWDWISAEEAAQDD